VISPSGPCALVAGLPGGNWQGSDLAGSPAVMAFPAQCRLPCASRWPRLHQQPARSQRATADAAPGGQRAAPEAPARPRGAFVPWYLRHHPALSVVSGYFARHLPFSIRGTVASTPDRFRGTGALCPAFAIFVPGYRGHHPGTRAGTFRGTGAVTPQRGPRRSGAGDPRRRQGKRHCVPATTTTGDHDEDGHNANTGGGRPAREHRKCHQMRQVGSLGRTGGRARVPEARATSGSLQSRALGRPVMIGEEVRSGAGNDVGCRDVYYTGGSRQP